MDDRELQDLLSRWKAPNEVPPHIEQRIFGAENWWRWLLRGSVRIPVPVLGFAVLLIAGGYLFFRDGVVEKRELRLADFQPVSEIKVRVIRSRNATH